MFYESRIELSSGMKKTTESAMNPWFFNEHKKVSVADLFDPAHRGQRELLLRSILD